MSSLPASRNKPHIWKRNDCWWVRLSLQDGFSQVTQYKTLNSALNTVYYIQTGDWPSEARTSIHSGTTDQPLGEGYEPAS